jgi:sec-independent protein translocase protein TatC
MTDPGNKLSILGHFQELRRRLIWSVLAVAIGAIICFVFRDWLIYYLKLPAGNPDLIRTEVTEAIAIYMRVALYGGIILAMPFITYHAIMFVSPALLPHEKKLVFLVLPWIAIMFLGGVAFGYFILLPPALRFLFDFGSNVSAPMFRIGNYISVVTRLLLAIGLVFEMPVVTTFLARIGIVKPDWLAGKRKIAIVIAFIGAAIITPTFDPINQSLVAVPLIALYEMSIWLARLVYRRKQEALVEVEAPTEG